MAKVLVVDDELVCTRVMSLILTELGYEVKTAASGEEALEIAEGFSPDVLVSDWKLARSIDGITLAGALQAERKELEVILFSGLPAEDVLAKAEGVRVFRILEKPCEANAIAQVIEESLHSRRYSHREKKFQGKYETISR